MTLFFCMGAVTLLALGFSFWISRNILKLDEGTNEMKEISLAIRTGANAYLKRQYMGVGMFFIVMFAILCFMATRRMMTWFDPFAFLTGGFFFRAWQVLLE